MKVGIIGGGMMGLASAYYLSRAGIQAVVLEKEESAGGLSRSSEILPGLRWDRYYHVILSTDTELLGFLEEIGLAPDIAFKTTKTGFFTDGRLHSMSNIREFLTFKPLPMSSKLRLGAGIFLASRLKNGSRLEKLYARTWLTRVFGRRNYEKMWEPLLRSKLGSASSKASGSFIWAIIKRYYGTRHKSGKQEMMGCVRGGYHSILRKIDQKLRDKQVEVKTGYWVKGIEPLADGRIKTRDDKGAELVFDKVLATLPNPALIRLLPDPTGALADQLRRIEYLNLVCMVLVLNKPLCPYYVTNLTDPGFPFTGVIDASNIVPETILRGRGLVYLPRWMPAEDSFIGLPDEEIIDRFDQGLRKIFPGFTNEAVIARQVHRELHVQPIQTIGYEQKIPPAITGIEGLYVCNTSMILNSTLNNNKVIELARGIAAKIAQAC